MEKKLNIISTKLEIHYMYDTDISVYVSHDTFEGGNGTQLEISSGSNLTEDDSLGLDFNSLQDLKDFGNYIVNCAKDVENKLKIINK